MIRLIAPNGSKLLDIRTNTEHSEVVCTEKNRRYYILTNDTGSIIEETLEGTTTNLLDRVATLEEELEAAKIVLGVE